MAVWFEVYPGRNGKVLEFGDFPTKNEVFEKLQSVGVISKVEDTDEYDIDMDCSFIGVYNNGELFCRYEIE